MEIQFTKLSPTQNMTILVESKVPREKYVQTANALMDYGSVYAEQVGFIEQSKAMGAWARLQMMGGEFCGNAAMSLAAFLVWRDKIEISDKLVVPLEVSGSNSIIPCEVSADGSNYSVEIEMPKPESVEIKSLKIGKDSYDAGIVSFEGIVHVIISDEQVEGDKRAFAENIIPILAERFTEEAIGVILFEQSTLTIAPLIYVKSVASLVWERGCGSGTAAIGAYLSFLREQSITEGVKQPGGTIAVNTVYNDGAVCEVSITGCVKISARGTAYI